MSVEKRRRHCTEPGKYGGVHALGQRALVSTYLSSETVINIVPISRREKFDAEMKVMLRVVVMASTKSTTAMFPTAESAGTLIVTPPAETVTFMVAFDNVDVVR